MSILIRFCMLDLPWWNSNSVFNKYFQFVFFFLITFKIWLMIKSFFSCWRRSHVSVPSHLDSSAHPRIFLILTRLWKEDATLDHRSSSRSTDQHHNGRVQWRFQKEYESEVQSIWIYSGKVSQEECLDMFQSRKRIQSVPFHLELCGDCADGQHWYGDRRRGSDDTEVRPSLRRLNLAC